MNILVIGSGGREHTLVWKLKQSPKVDKIYCAPGNGGIAQIAECVPIGVMEFDKLISFVKSNNIALTVVGPEDPLCGGIVDEFEKNGLRIFGPNRKGAQLEGNKIFAKNLMTRYGIPTAKHKEFDNSREALEYLQKAGLPIVIKAHGNAMGKGVSVCRTLEDADSFIRRCLDENEFGEAGKRIIIEEYLIGEEASVLAFTDGKTILQMESAQDHKPIFDDDKGPNTGGMGAYSPAPVVTPEIAKKVYNEILEPVVRALSSEGIKYKGVVYAGLIINKDSIKVLEFNARFGDPEAQALLPRLENDLIEIIEAIIDERLNTIKLKWSKKPAVAVVIASGGYPGHYEKGKIINGLDKASSLPQTIIFHAGTKKQDSNIITSGGRVLAVTSLADTLDDAISTAYKAVNMIQFEGAHYRKDIGAKALARMKQKRQKLYKE